MIFIAILIGCILGAILGINAPMISYTYSSYLAIAIIAALDSVFGGITSVIKKNFDSLQTILPADCNDKNEKLLHFFNLQFNFLQYNIYELVLYLK